MTDPQRLATAAGSLDVHLSQRQLDALDLYADRLATSATNLVSARDRDLIERRHIFESLACGAVLEQHGLLGDGTRLLDLGAGGGLPGIPLKIAWPAIELTLLESVGRKCRFLEQVADELALEDVTVLEGRAEIYGRDPGHRGHYDLVVARAVAALPVLVEYALPFLRLGGRLAALKGMTAAAEIEAAENALRELGGAVIGTPGFDPPDGPRQTVVLIEKRGPTPERYPRREGMPGKRPL
jgi:16S rRNA (guanine527-N7)-methyltransferase